MAKRLTKKKTKDGKIKKWVKLFPLSSLWPQEVKNTEKEYTNK